jgi:hypothetical protein
LLAPARRRNLLVFDPLKPDSNGYSYNDIMIKPITAAARAALAANAGKRRAGGAKAANRKTLMFGMQGEASGGARPEDGGGAL